MKKEFIRMKVDARAGEEMPGAGETPGAGATPSVATEDDAKT